MKRGVFQKLSEEIIQDVISRVQEHREPVTQIAKQLGVHPMVLYNHLKRRDVKTPRVGKRSQANHLTLPNDPLILAYVAGLVDGEGHIMNKSFIQKKSGKAWDCWHTRVTIYNTDEPVIRWLHETFGGNFHAKKLRACPKNKQRMAQASYEWHMGAREDVALLLTALLPFLRIKKLKAKQLLDDITNSRRVHGTD